MTDAGNWTWSKDVTYTSSESSGEWILEAPTLVAQTTLRQRRHRSLRPDVHLHRRRRHPHDRRRATRRRSTCPRECQRGHAIGAGLGRPVVQRLRVRTELRNPLTSAPRPSGRAGANRPDPTLSAQASTPPSPACAHHARRHRGEEVVSASRGTPVPGASAPGTATPRRSTPLAHPDRSHRGEPGPPGTRRSAAS